MKKPLLIVFSILLSVNSYALSSYKCTPVESYGVTLEGVLQNDIDKFPNTHLSEWIEAGIVDDFIIDRETGRAFGGNYPFTFNGESFVITSQGTNNTEFKAYFVPTNGGRISINILEYKETLKKPFVYFRSPNPIILTGTCIHY